MPILNIQVKVEDNKIVYKWFKKEMLNYLLLLANSAMPQRTKRECLVQYAMTILLNTSRQLPWEVAADTLSEFAHRMLVSGYHAKFRLEVIQAAVVGYERKGALAENGGPPLYRPRDYQPKERRRKKLMSETSWYRPANTVGFFPATPNAVLAKEFQEILTEELGRLKMNGRIIEESGVSLKRLLVKVDLTGCIFKEDGCLLCGSGLPGGSHTRRGANYSATCTECEANNIKSIYYGETGKSGAYRVQKGHQTDIKNKNIKNALAKHLHNDHPDKEGDQTVFKYKIESTDKSCLQRQVREGANLAASDADNILNSRTEYHQPSLQRITLTREPRGAGG